MVQGGQTAGRIRELLAIVNPLRLADASWNDAERIVWLHLRVLLCLEHFELPVEELRKAFRRVLLKQQAVVLLELITEPERMKRSASGIQGPMLGGQRFLRISMGSRPSYPSANLMYSFTPASVSKYPMVPFSRTNAPRKNFG
jgi:hypothetical protein